MSRSGWKGLIAAGVLAASVAGCQGPPPAPPPAAGPTLSSQAADALNAGDYAKAADLYRRAIAGAPDSLPLHYGLAVAASHLNLKDEAIREFRWVLARAPKGSTESQAARTWLTRVGALTADQPPDARDEASSSSGPGQASLEGQMVMPEGASAQRRMLVLYGLPNSATKEERYQIRTDENGRFRFPSVTPGPYMLTDAVSGARNWRVRVELQPNQAATLDLTPTNHIKVKDDFPAATSG